MRDTIVRKPRNPGARLILVADMLLEECAAEALAVLGEVPPPADDIRALRHWHLQHALVMLQLGQPAEARAVLGALAARGPIPPEIAPLWHWRQVLLTQGEGCLASARATAERNGASLGAMGPQAVPEHRIMARYDLAKFWSGQNEHARAFAHWIE